MLRSKNGHKFNKDWYDYLGRKSRATLAPQHNKVHKRTPSATSFSTYNNTRTNQLNSTPQLADIQDLNLDFFVLVCLSILHSYGFPLSWLPVSIIHSSPSPIRAVQKGRLDSFRDATNVIRRSHPPPSTPAWGPLPA